MKRPNAGRLCKVIIKRDGDAWHVIREREKNGESGTFLDLDNAFDFVRCLYEKDGQQKQMEMYDGEPE